MVDAVASDYLNDVAFVAVAGRSGFSASEKRVGDWFSPEKLMWGYDDDLWGLYGVRGQPTTILISGDDVVIEAWYGNIGADEIRAALDGLVAIG